IVIVRAIQLVGACEDVFPQSKRIHGKHVVCDGNRAMRKPTDVERKTSIQIAVHACDRASRHAEVIEGKFATVIVLHITAVAQLDMTAVIAAHVHDLACSTRHVERLEASVYRHSTSPILSKRNIY